MFNNLLVRKGSRVANLGTIMGVYMEILYKGYCRGPLPHSPLSSSKTIRDMTYLGILTTRGGKGAQYLYDETISSSCAGAAFTSHSQQRRGSFSGAGAQDFGTCAHEALLGLGFRV